MRSAAGGVVLGWLILAAASLPAYADGGLLRWSEVRGSYRISVFTAPTPFRQGPVDISVLIQEQGTGELVTSVRVIVRMTKAGQPALEYPATRGAATNKLFRAAQFDLPAWGRWDCQVQVEGPYGPAVIGGELEAAAALPRWQELGLWIGWPALAIGLFVLHRLLMRSKIPVKTGRAGVNQQDRLTSS